MSIILTSYEEQTDDSNVLTRIKTSVYLAPVTRYRITIGATLNIKIIKNSKYKKL